MIDMYMSDVMYVLQVFLACHAIAAFCCIAYTLVPPVQICLPRMVDPSTEEGMRDTFVLSVCAVFRVQVTEYRA